MKFFYRAKKIIRGKCSSLEINRTLTNLWRCQNHDVINIYYVLARSKSLKDNKGLGMGMHYSRNNEIRVKLIIAV